MHRFLIHTAILVLLTTSTYTQSAATSLGPLSPYIHAGNDGTWRVTDDGQSAFLENRETEGAVTYYYVGSHASEEGSRTISVDVGFGQTTQWSSAGLLYGYIENPKTYYMVTVRGDSTINIHQLVDGYFDELMVIPMESLSAEKTTLTIQEEGNSVTLLVNGQKLESFSDDQLGRGAVGIVASDIGQYKFSNFTVSSKKTTDGSGGVLNGGNIMPTSKSGPEKPQDPGDVGEESKTARDKASAAVSTVERKKYFAAIDPRFDGMASSYTPYPASWKQLPGHPEYYFEGPNGIKISNTFGQNFQFSSNPDGLQMLNMQGVKNTPPYSFQQILDEIFMPYAKQNNRELIETYPLPEYTQTRTDFVSRLFKSVPVRETVNCHAMEWKDDKGLSYITVLTVVVSEAFPVSSWYLQGQYLVAENAYFDVAKDAFLYGLVHSEVNPKWLQTVNQQDAQRAGKSWAAHNSRMAAIQSRSTAGKSVSDIYSEISDISHAGYLKRSSIQSHGHTSSVRAANETSLIANHNTGEHYEVDGNYNHHWVNSNGVYIATDNALFDPRADEQLKIFEWSQFQKER